MFLHVFAFQFFIHFPEGPADPICPYVRTPMDGMCSCGNSTGTLRYFADDKITLLGRHTVLSVCVRVAEKQQVKERSFAPSESRRVDSGGEVLGGGQLSPHQ